MRKVAKCGGECGVRRRVRVNVGLGGKGLVGGEEGGGMGEGRRGRRRTNRKICFWPLGGWKGFVKRGVRERGARARGMGGLRIFFVLFWGGGEKGEEGEGGGL